MRDYASIKVTQLEQELTKTNKTVRQKANSWFATVTTKTASQLKPFPASQKPPGDTQCQLAIALDIVIISIINTVIVFFFLLLLLLSSLLQSHKEVIVIYNN